MAVIMGLLGVYQRQTVEEIVSVGAVSFLANNIPEKFGWTESHKTN